MLLRFFRINDPYRLLGLLFVVVAISLVFFIDRPSLTIPELRGFLVGEAITNGQRMYSQIIDSTAPLMAAVYGLADWLFGRSVPARQVIALLLIFAQSAFFAILLISNKAYNDSTYVPALIFGVLCFFSFDVFSFSPELIGSSVLLLALNYLFKAVEFRSERDEIILNLGVCLGIATLIIFSYVVFLLVTVVILFVFTRPSIRKVLLLLFGFLLPHLAVLTLYYLRGETAALWSGFYQINFTVHGTVWMSGGGLLILAIIPAAYFLMSIFMLNREARFTKYQSQLFQVMLFWLFGGIIQISVTRDLSPHSFILFVPSLSYFISHYLLLIRRKWIGEAMLWIFIGGILLVSLLGRYGAQATVDYSRMFVTTSLYPNTHDKRIMTVGPEITVFRTNQQAGYFLEWELSRAILEHPEYYENVMLVSQSINSGQPDLIIDQQDKMKGFFERVPELRRQYVRDGDFYLKVKPTQPSPASAKPQ